MDASIDRGGAERRLKRRSRTGLVVALTTLAHVALLVGLSRVAPSEPLEPPNPPDIQVELTQTLPSATLGTRRTLGLTPYGQAAEPPIAATARKRSQTRLHQAPPQPSAPQPRSRAQASPSRASSRSPAASAPQPTTGATEGAPGAAPSPGAGRGAGPDAVARGDMRSTLRTSVGCVHADYLRLTPAEREACARQFGRQASIGARQWVDPLSSAAERAALDRERDRCQSLHHYATPLDEDANHSAKPPGMWGPGALGC